MTRHTTIKMQVKFVMSINEHVMMSSGQRSSLCHPIHLLIYEQQTRGLPYVHTRLTALFPGLPMSSCCSVAG